MAAIYDTTIISEKADISVINPYAAYTHPKTGDPISGGFLYFGLVGRDGEIAENRKKVYAVQEDGTSVSLEQPVTLTSGGIPQYEGNPVILAVDGSYSLTVNDSNGDRIYFAGKVPAKSLLGYSGVIPEEAKTYQGNATIKFNSIEASTASFYASTSSDGSEFKGQYLRLGVDYNVVDESTITLLGSYTNGDVILGRALDPTGQTVSVYSSTNPLYIYGVKADAVNQSLEIGDSVLINGGDTIEDGNGGSYLVVAGGTGVADGYTYIDLSNGNQLKLKTSYELFKSYYETVSNASISGGKVTIDLSNSNISNVSLTENITSIEVLNIPASGEVKIQFQVTQDATPKTLAWQVNGSTPKAPGGTIPTVTASAGAIDLFVLKTSDGGANWMLFTIGQDIK